MGFDETKFIPGKPERCPNCGGRDIRPSWMRGLGDKLHQLMSKYPYRCRVCEHRFYRRMKRIDVESEGMVAESGAPSESARSAAAGES